MSESAFGPNVDASQKLVGGSAAHATRIFVVEDEVIICDDITQTLRHLGYEIAGVAQSGLSALLEIEQVRPDLVLMDIKLAGRIDGIQATAAIRKRWSIPVIYLTSHSDEATLTRAKETGPHGYLLKPFNERDLRTAIEVALRKHELEQKLEQRERWFSTTLESVGDAVIATNAADRITFMNPIAEEVTGWKKEDAYNKPIGEVFKLLAAPADDAQVVSRAIRDGFRAELPPAPRLLNRERVSNDVDDSTAAIVDGEGRVLGNVVVFRDATEKRRLEERLALAERLASISTMAAGMAHEINNPLAATVGNVEFAARRLAELADEASRLAQVPRSLLQGLKEARDALADAQTAGSRVRRIVSDLKKFSRAETPTRETLDLPDVIDAALSATNYLVKSDTHLHTRLGTTPLVDANEGQLVQVFVNLIANAVQAGEGAPGHRVEITTSTDELGRAVVEVRDSGRGIRAEDLPHIFDPFFTTKPVGDGLGLGLSICQNVVSALGGEISVDSQLGSGAKFRVVLPAADARTRQTRTSTLPPASTRRARILVIDDEEIVGRAIERMLCQVHEVHRETDPRQALSRLARGEPYDVVLCDLTMPTLNGMAVYQSIQSANPELAKRIIFLTGGATSEKLQEFLDSSSNLVVQKPFSIDRLLAAVASHIG